MSDILVFQTMARIAGSLNISVYSLNYERSLITILYFLERNCLKFFKATNKRAAAVAQLVRAFSPQAEGWEFEFQLRQNLVVKNW